MGVNDSFQQLHAMICLHIWLLLVRLRAEGKDGKHLAQASGLLATHAAAGARHESALGPSLCGLHALGLCA
jgi:hypothetical protein